MLDLVLDYEAGLGRDDDQKVWLLILDPVARADERHPEPAWIDIPALGSPEQTAAAVLGAVGGPVELAAQTQGVIVGERTAFLLTGEIHGERRMVCLVTQSEPRPPVVDGLMARWYFRRVVSQGVSVFAGGSSVPLWIHRSDAHGLDALSVGVLPLVAHVPTAQTADDIASEVFHDTVIPVETASGVVRIGPAGPSGMQHVIAHRRGEDLETVGVLPAGTDPELLFQVQPDDEIMGLTYFPQVVAQLQAGRPRLAFRAYYYFLRLAPARDAEQAEQAIALGFDVLHRLDDGEDADYVEWIATAIADLALRHGLQEQAADALRHAGVAASSLGWSDRCVTHFERALTLPGVSERERARLQMSFGICLNEFCAGQDLDAPLDDRHRGYALKATEQLRQAVQGYSRVSGERSEWSLHSIALELARAADLRGEHDAAAAQLQKLADRPVIANDLNLFSTAVVYALMAWRNAVAAERGESRADYVQYCLMLAKGQKIFNNTRTTGLYNLLLADALAETGSHRAALGLYGTAHLFQSIAFEPVSNALGPDRALDGWLAVDTTDRILAAARHGGEGAAHAALCLADNTKSRFFRRDLGLQLEGLRTPEPGVTLRIDRENRRHLFLRDVDQRIILAEQEWLAGLEAEEPPQAPSRAVTTRLVLKLQGESDGDGSDLGSAAQHELTPATLADLWHRLPENSALISLYAGHSRTTLIIQRDQSTAPVFHTLPVAASALRSVATALQEHFSGTGVYPKVNPKRPGRYDAVFWQPFADLAPLFAPIAATLADRDLVVLSGHGPWHHLPVHALLLPEIWRRGIPGPGLCYTPSFGLQRLLLARGDTQPWGAFTDIAVTTAPSRNDDADAFRGAHDRICAALAPATPRLRQSFGLDATAHRFHEVSASSIHHVLAHGIHREGPDVMGSGVLLSSNGQLPVLAEHDEHTLPAHDLMLRDAIAEHLTVQACSLGRTLVAESDELWGFNRAALASGARSVLAPLWDINLASSTALLDAFYRAWLHDGTDKHRAWTSVQRAMYENGAGNNSSAWTHPYHWAAFTMVGV